MAIYDFSMATGYELTGVDTVMCYRAKALKEMGCNVKLIFPYFPGIRELKLFTDMGVEYDQFLPVHIAFSDVKCLEPTLDLEEQLQQLKDVLHYTEILEKEESILLIKDGNIVAEVLFTKDRFYSVQYFVHGCHTRRDYYSDVLYASDIYETIETDGKYLAVKVKKLFYNRDGSVSLIQMFHGEQTYHFLPDGRCLNQAQLFNLFVKKLGMTEEDLVLIDRPGNGFSPKAVFECSERTPVVTILHSEHFFEKGLSVLGDNLNYEYWYWFKYSNHIRTMVVSTAEQKNYLVNTLEYYNFAVPDIRVIPVLGLRNLSYPVKERKQKSMICVSRLHERKKIDWTIYTAIKAHAIDHEISLDIYGTGRQSYMEYLNRLIEENDASDYIKLKGYMDVTDVYKNYELYLTTSLWETFGITLLEATGSGLALVGLDVKYGNRTFIKGGYNGYLVPYDPQHFNETNPPETDMLAEKIIDIFSDEKKLDAFHRHSYEIAGQYLNDQIKEKWYELVGEL